MAFFMVTKTVQVKNCVGDMLFDDYRPDELGSLAMDDTFKVVKTGSTRLFAFIVNHPRSNRGKSSSSR